MKYEHPVTPAVISQPIVSLCTELASEALPLYVDVSHSPNASANDCFQVVERQVATEGGSSVLGWSIWELPRLFVEAEFHATWRSVDGTLLDITPKKHQVERILFLPEASLRYEGRQVNNIRRPSAQLPAVIEFLQTFDKEFEIINRGERATQHAEIYLEEEEALEMHKLRLRRDQLILMLHSMWPEVGPYDPCWCSSGKKTKWCHGVR